MSLIRWQPFGELDNFMDDFTPALNSGFDLAVDIYEKKGNLVAEMNLPGIDAKDVDISVEGDHLRISGSRKEEKEEKSKNFFSKEIRRGYFERVVDLPESVDGKKVKAEYKNGVLKITMPKLKKHKSDKVKIEVKD